MDENSTGMNKKESLNAQPAINLDQPSVTTEQVVVPSVIHTEPVKESFFVKNKSNVIGVSITAVVLVVLAVAVGEILYQRHLQYVEEQRLAEEARIAAEEAETLTEQTMVSEKASSSWFLLSLKKLRQAGFYMSSGYSGFCFLVLACV